VSVVVIELGCANTASVLMALERLGVAARLSSSPSEIAEAERLILPGVGAAGFAMSRIATLGLREVLRAYRRPLLGVCLGQQLLFEHADEGNVACLGLIPGRVTKIDAAKAGIVPHMGWNTLSDLKPDPLTEGLSAGDYAYFVHSFACPINEATLATCDYGAPFAALVRRSNVWGAQFHPERSSETGARLLRNFIGIPA
jgi:imidazole glycerol-phosphate synthase subunit HisH